MHQRAIIFLDRLARTVGVQPLRRVPRHAMWAAVYGRFIIASTHSGNRNLIPVLILAGSFAVPLTVLVLFF